MYSAQDRTTCMHACMYVSMYVHCAMSQSAPSFGARFHVHRSVGGNLTTRGRVVQAFFPVLHRVGARFFPKKQSKWPRSTGNFARSTAHGFWTKARTTATGCAQTDGSHKHCRDSQCHGLRLPKLMQKTRFWRAANKYKKQKQDTN